MNSLDFVNQMPYFLHVEILKHIYKKVYKANTLVYDVDESNCDCLYFVLEGKLKVEAQVTITQ